MEKSTNYGFNLPSRDTDDIVDINQISDNFRTLDEKLPEFINKGETHDEDISVSSVSNSLGNGAVLELKQSSGEASLSGNRAAELVTSEVTLRLEDGAIKVGQTGTTDPFNWQYAVNIKNIQLPAEDFDAANKAYVDSELHERDEQISEKIETFKVAITTNEDGTYSADKTYDEIMAAYNEGKLVSAIGISDGFHVTLSLVNVGADYIIFSLTTQENLIDLYIGSDNTVSLTQSKMLVGTLVSEINSNSPTTDNAPSEHAVVNYVNMVLSDFIDVSEVGQ